MSDTTSRAPLGRRFGDLAQDGAAIGGAGLITWGVALIDRPAALITAGVFLLSGAWLSARKADA